MDLFSQNNEKMRALLHSWEPRLAALSEQIVTERTNRQQRNIREIVGHIADSASNNIHRIVHLQYQPNPLVFPDYANLGNNDRWIAIQNYNGENWPDLVQLWKYSTLHVIHVMENINPDKLDNVWLSGLGEPVTLREMAQDYLRHFELHLGEIEELLEAPE